MLGQPHPADIGAMPVTRERIGPVDGDRRHRESPAQWRCQYDLKQQFHADSRRDEARKQNRDRANDAAPHAQNRK
jgi:hypothetical protein